MAEPMLLRRATDRHPVIPDIGRPVMAKANVRIPDIDWKQAVGSAIDRAVSASGWLKGETAGQIDVDDRELCKWLTGERRPHLDRLFANDRLRPLVIVELARLDESVRIRTVIELSERRSA